MDLSKLAGTFARSRRWCFERWIAPALRRTAGLLLRWSTHPPKQVDSSGQWKQKALDDFSSWLAALPDFTPDGAPGPQGCDLYILLTEFAALRQEIRLQTRQQHTTLKTLEELARQFGQIGEQFQTSIVRMDQLHDAWRQRVEESAVVPFLDIRDALVRGERAAKSATQVRGLWRRPPKGIETVVEGYAMALRRFDRALDRLGVKPLITVDRPFDAACMRAVGKGQVADKDRGVVLEEIVGGFMRADNVLRPAEVIVNSD